MKLWLDDLREPTKFLGNIGKSFIWARTYEEAIHMLEKDNIDYISLDHDLGTKKTGYDVLLYIEKRTFTDKKYSPPKIGIHTSNPSAAIKMKACKDKIEEISRMKLLDKK